MITKQLIESVRRLNLYKIWKKRILIRDNHTCQFCGSWEELEIHHVIRLVDMMLRYNISSIKQALKSKELFNIDLGISLCLFCHRELHE